MIKAVIEEQKMGIKCDGAKREDNGEMGVQKKGMTRRKDKGVVGNTQMTDKGDMGGCKKRGNRGREGAKREG